MGDIGPIPETEDELLELIQEKMGWFKMIQLVILCSMIIPVGMADFSSVFYNMDPVSVRSPSAPNGTSFDLYRSQETCVQHNLSTEGLTYVFKRNHNSVIQDLNLVCGDYWKSAFSITLYFLGQMLSNPFVGWFADRYGRRPTLLFSNILYTSVSLGLAFSKDYISFAVLRFFVGVGRQVINNAFFVLLLEWQVPKYRTRASAFVQFLYFFAGLLLALVAYLLQDWRKIQIVLAVSNAAALGSFWFAPESLRWLIMNNRVDEAKVVCRKVAKLNRVTIAEEQLQCIDWLAELKSRGIKKTHHYTIIDLFRTPYLTIFSLVITLFWSVIQIVNYGIAFMLDEVFKQNNASFAISQFLCMIPQGLNIHLTTVHKNRVTLIVYLLIGGIFLLIAATVSPDTKGGKTTVQAMAILGRMMVVGGYAAAMAMSADLYPTVVRNNGMGLVNIAIRIGSIAAVPLSTAADKAARAGIIFKGLPFAIMAGGCLLAAIGTSILPETKNMPLLTSIEDAESFGRRKLFSLLRKLLPRKHVPVDPSITQESIRRKSIARSVSQAASLSDDTYEMSTMRRDSFKRIASRRSIFTDGDVTTNYL